MSIRTPVRCLSLSLDVEISLRAPEEENCRSCMHLDESGCPRWNCGVLDAACGGRVTDAAVVLEVMALLSRLNCRTACWKLDGGGMAMNHGQQD